uniref:Uncharacterized protein n=1 Tax=Daphnia magna TaxID=35525 RepID=A0A0N8CHH5_9CRUS
MAFYGIMRYGCPAAKRIQQEEKANFYCVEYQPNDSSNVRFMPKRKSSVVVCKPTDPRHPPKSHTHRLSS